MRCTVTAILTLQLCRMTKIHHIQLLVVGAFVSHKFYEGFLNPKFVNFLYKLIQYAFHPWPISNLCRNRGWLSSWPIKIDMMTFFEKLVFTFYCFITHWTNHLQFLWWIIRILYTWLWKSFNKIYDYGFSASLVYGSNISKRPTPTDAQESYCP